MARQPNLCLHPPADFLALTLSLFLLAGVCVTYATESRRVRSPLQELPTCPRSLIETREVAYQWGDQRVVLSTVRDTSAVHGVSVSSNGRTLQPAHIVWANRLITETYCDP